MVKREIIIDEHWPVFTLEEPKRDGPFVVEINEDFYKEYCYFMYKYHEYQTRLQVIYEHAQREYNGDSFKEDRESDGSVPTDASKASLRAFLHEGD